MDTCRLPKATDLKFVWLGRGTSWFDNYRPTTVAEFMLQNILAMKCTSICQAGVHVVRPKQNMFVSDWPTNSIFFQISISFF